MKTSPVVRVTLQSFAACLAFATAGCASLTRAPALESQAAPVRAVVRVQDRWLPLRLSRPSGNLAGPLVLFVTGDGGWHGKDLDAFRHLVEWGHPVAGFSAPDYLDHLRGDARSLRPRQLARDFADVIGAARVDLGLPADTRAVLLGVSRGGDLVVVAAAQLPLRSSVAGVLAIGLTGEEEYVHHRPHGLFGGRSPIQTTRPGPTEAGTEMVRPYEYLPRIATPVCLIQSTNDQYVRAAEAQQLFGPDTATRRFHAIQARNHSFGGARSTLYDLMRASLDWLIAPAVPPRAVGNGS